MEHDGERCLSAIAGGREQSRVRIPVLQIVKSCLSSADGNRKARYCLSTPLGGSAVEGISAK